VRYVVFSPTNPNSETQSRDLQEVARKLALQLHTLRASTERDLDTVFVTVAQLRAGARSRSAAMRSSRAGAGKLPLGGAACDSDDFLYA
jgi:hypothetical protein